MVARRRRRKIGLKRTKSDIYVTPRPRQAEKQSQRINNNKRRKPTTKPPKINQILDFKRAKEDYTPEKTGPKRFKPTPFIHLK